MADAGATGHGLLLALDTATRWATIALADEERLLAETSWEAGREHSSGLLAEVERMLGRAGVAVTALTGIVVARGPGSFTGVRVALSVAKGMAIGLGVPVWGVDVLDALGRAAGPVGLPVRAVVELGRGRWATALYEDGRRVQPDRGAGADEILALVRNPTYVIGDLSADLRRRLVAETAAVVAGPAASVRRAGYLAELGREAAMTGDPGRADELEAVYLAGA